jgi:chemotaxis protein MotB
MRKGPGGSRKTAKPEEAKEEALHPAREPKPAAVLAELLPSLEYLSEELKDEIKSGKMQMSLQPRGLVVSLSQAAFFPSGEDRIEPATYPSIGKVASAIRKLPNPVRLEGHTDSVPIHNSRFRSNWELSAARAVAMLELLTRRFSIPPERCAIAGYADNAPVDNNDSEEGRSRNRRVDIVILNTDGLLREPPPASANHAGQKAGTKPAT